MRARAQRDLLLALRNLQDSIGKSAELAEMVIYVGRNPAATQPQYNTRGTSGCVSTEQNAGVPHVILTVDQFDRHLDNRISCGYEIQMCT